MHALEKRCEGDWRTVRCASCGKVPKRADLVGGEHSVPNPAAQFLLRNFLCKPAAPRPDTLFTSPGGLSPMAAGIDIKLRFARHADMKRSGGVRSAGGGAEGVP